LREGISEEVADKIRRNTFAGIPTGDDRFVAEIKMRRDRPSVPSSVRGFQQIPDQSGKSLENDG
jgi:hypothetical protein